MKNVRDIPGHEGRYRSWCTPTDNIGDKIFHGTYLNGEKCHMAKLNWRKVRLARKFFSSGKYSKAELARHFGITPTAMGHILNNNTWKI